MLSSHCLCVALQNTRRVKAKYVYVILIMWEVYILFWLLPLIINRLLNVCETEAIRHALTFNLITGIFTHVTATCIPFIQYDYAVDDIWTFVWLTLEYSERTDLIKIWWLIMDYEWALVVHKERCEITGLCRCHEMKANALISLCSLTNFQQLKLLTLYWYGYDPSND